MILSSERYFNKESFYLYLILLLLLFLILRNIIIFYKNIFSPSSANNNIYKVQLATILTIHLVFIFDFPFINNIFEFIKI